MADNVDKVWKSSVAADAFKNLTFIAGQQKERLLSMVDQNNHSEYERSLLKIQITEAYMRSLANVYHTANEIECQAMSLHASLCSMVGE
ncbi:MAG: hypothetical protein PHI12_10855 [Dehalococcoidales bacterium]|nr:hypothetical protein [Dehalococcoidales bacterium]